MSVANTDERAVLAATVSQLAGAIDGTGVYHYDVSSAVILGAPTEPPTAWPCCYVEAVESTKDNAGNGRTPLGQFACVMSMRLYLFAPVSTTGGTESQLQAWDAVTDLTNGMASSQTLGGVVHLMRFTGSGVVVGTDADNLGSGRAVGIVDVEVEWTRSFG